MSMQNDLWDGSSSDEVGRAKTRIAKGLKRKAGEVYAPIFSTPALRLSILNFFRFFLLSRTRFPWTGID